MSSGECSQCDKPVPREWCWQGDPFCPSGKPPRYGPDLSVFKDWLARNGHALCTCGHPYRRHLADFSGCADCDVWEPVHLRCGGFNLDRAPSDDSRRMKP